MRKYDLLKVIFERKEGVRPKELSQRLKTSITNVYSYLKELKLNGFIESENGKYAINQGNLKLRQLLDLKAMAPDKFHKLIMPSFKDVLSKLCEQTKVPRRSFQLTEIRQIEQLGVPLRIALKLSKRPTIYSLKINESLVQTLLTYHNLQPKFNLLDFDKTIQAVNLKKRTQTTIPVENEPVVIEMCDQAYLANEDISPLRKAQNFSLDERLTHLLTKAEQINTEYKLFINALEPELKKTINKQWQMKYIYNTNSIEGNTMSEKEVEEYLENGKEKQNISKRELYETTNIRHALGFLDLKKNQNQDLNESVIKDIHFQVHKDIEDTPGEYKQVYNYVKPNSPTTPPQHVKERMKLLLKWYDENKPNTHPVVLAAIVHMQFELIHPFADGNGRVGRLAMNYILERSNFLPLTLLEKTKQIYYNALQNRNINQFLLYILTSFIEEYKR